MPFPHVIEPLGEALFNKRLGGQNHPVAIKFHFEIVARLQTQLIVDSLGDDDLAAHPNFDGQSGTICPSLCFHIFVFYVFRTNSQGMTCAGVYWRGLFALRISLRKSSARISIVRHIS